MQRKKTLFFIVNILLILVLLSAPFYQVNAAANSAITISPPTPEASSEYVLPYPGILPDHPLYPLKLLRDKIVLFLTRDKLEKINLKRHLADKRLAMALLLVKQGKKALGIKTLDDAEIYLHQAIDDLFALLRQRSDVDESNVDLMDAALSKHGEILGTMTDITYEENLAIKQALLRIRMSQERLRQFRKGEFQ